MENPLAIPEILKEITEGNFVDALSLCLCNARDYKDYVYFQYLHTLALYSLGKRSDAMRTIVQAFVLIENRSDKTEYNEHFHSILKKLFDDILLDGINNIKQPHREVEHDLIYACLSAIFTQTKIKFVFFSESSLYTLAKTLLTKGYYKECILVAQTLVAISDTKNTFQFTIIIEMEDIGITDNKLHYAATGKAIKSLRGNPSNVHALIVLLSYAYRKHKHSLIERIVSVVRKIHADNLDTYSQIRQYYMFRTSNAFFLTQVLNRKSNFTCTEFVSAEKNDGAVMFFVSCDEVYFNMAARRLIDSLMRLEGEVCLHVNIVDPSPETKGVLAEIAAHRRLFGYSFFYSDAINRQTIAPPWDIIRKKTIYACSRFFVLPEILKVYDKPVIILDVDQDVVSPTHQFIEEFSKKFHHDVAVKFDTNLLGPGRDCWIDMTAFANTMTGNMFARMMKNYILYFIEDDYAFWMLDQVAFLAVQLQMKSIGYAPNIYFFNKDDFQIGDYFAHYGGAHIRNHP
ncbi:hypothetical protein CCP3SC1_180023 [Gammaproteobacteria bacterium]